MEREILLKKLKGENIVDEHSLKGNLQGNAIHVGEEYYSQYSENIAEALWLLDNEVKNVTETARKKGADNSKHLALFKLTVRWLALLQKNIRIEQWLDRKGYNSIAIYGMHYLGERLFDELEGSPIRIEYTIDKKLKMQYKGADNYNDFSNLPKVDAVIVTPITFFDEIYTSLEQSVECPIVSLDTIISELEE